METHIINSIIEALNSKFNKTPDSKLVTVQKTRPGIKGDFTVNVFPFVKEFGMAPQKLAEFLGQYIVDNQEFISSFEVINGFLNLVVDDKYWEKELQSIINNPSYGHLVIDKTKKPILVEYSSPNTNKPLHLGHIRNNLLGYSIATILEAAGNNVVKVNLVNDRGIHICKSMLAWERWGEGETPEQADLKGDHLVGKYYVMFDKALKEEIKNLVECGTLEENAMSQSALMEDAQQMLRDWEAGDDYVTKLWIKMNNWVCAGFEQTYNRMGVNFDKVYYESDTYLLGKDIVKKGFEEGYLYQKDDNSIWIDLKDEGLDEKLLLRGDGTSVYMTQDLGTADLRHKDFNPEKMLYVVGDEQNYHFNVLKLVFKKLGYKYWNDLVHISYGMVELPEGKMKSREGTVVDADDLLDEMIETAEKTTLELGKTEGFNQEELKKLFETLGLGALKYFILKVDPKKKMLFNPKESIDFNGNTGPFIQYTHARIRSLANKYGNENITIPVNYIMNEKERDLVILLSEYPATVQLAAANYSPAIIANYCYNLVKEYNQFYHDYSVLKAETEDAVKFRVLLSLNVGKVVKLGMSLLGIDVPEKM